MRTRWRKHERLTGARRRVGGARGVRRRLRAADPPASSRRSGLSAAGPAGRDGGESRGLEDFKWERSFLCGVLFEWRQGVSWFSANAEPRLYCGARGEEGLAFAFARNNTLTHENSLKNTQNGCTWCSDGLEAS